MATEYDMTQVVNAIRSLPGDEGRETTLCLLGMLLPFQLRLSGLAKKRPTKAEVVQLERDLMAWYIQLRDRLLEDVEAPTPVVVTPNNLKRILLVEDDERWQGEYLRRLRRLSGWEVAVAASHEDLAVKLVAGQFGVLLLDESLWERKRIYVHQYAVRGQVANGARVFSLSSSPEAAADMAKAFGTRVNPTWSKPNVSVTSLAELVSAIEG